MRQTMIAALAATCLAALTGCASAPPARGMDEGTGYYGTLEPFASEAVYFVLTDRFVNGDPSNDQRGQGKAKGDAFFTFDRPVPGAPTGTAAGSLADPRCSNLPA